jgi:hypothetical protein
MPEGELDEVTAIAHLACRKLNLARFGELAGIAEQIEKYLPQPHGIDGQCAEVLLGVNDEAVLVLLGELSGGNENPARCAKGGVSGTLIVSTVRSAMLT